MLKGKFLQEITNSAHTREKRTSLSPQRTSKLGRGGRAARGEAGGDRTCRLNMGEKVGGPANQVQDESKKTQGAGAVTVSEEGDE